MTYEFPENVGSMGGVGRVTYDVAKQFSGKRNNIDIAVITPKGTNYRDFDRRQPFRIIRITNKLFFKEAIMLLQSIIHLFKYNVDTIFCSTWLPSGFIAYLVSSIFRIPYIVMAHGSEILDNQNSGKFLKEKLRQALKVSKKHVYNNSQCTFSISRFTKGLLVKEGVYPDKIVIINNGVNVKKFKPIDVSSEFRRKYSIEQKKVLLTVSRLDKHKGHDIVINALPTVLKDVKELHYLIIGKGNEEKKLKALVKKLNLENYVSFLGFVSEEELVMFYNASDVFILVSREIPGDFEGFGLVYLEANACGKPVIGAKTGGIEDAIKHGKTGLLLRDVRMYNVAEAVLELLMNKDYAVKLGKTGLAQIRKYRTWEYVTDEILRFIKAGFK